MILRNKSTNEPAPNNHKETDELQLFPKLIKYLKVWRKFLNVSNGLSGKYFHFEEQHTEFWKV